MENIATSPCRGERTRHLRTALKLVRSFSIPRASMTAGVDESLIVESNSQVELLDRPLLLAQTSPAPPTLWAHRVEEQRFVTSRLCRQLQGSCCSAERYPQSVPP